MKRLSVITLAAYAIIGTSVSAQVRPSPIVVHDFRVEDRTLNILQKLAQEYRVVIGVSGVLLGRDNKTINISIQDGTLEDVFGAIVKEDSRFEWQKTKNEAFHFSVRGAPLDLAGAQIREFAVNGPSRQEASTLLMQIPEVNTWLRRNNCNAREMIFGHPPGAWQEFSVEAKAVPFSSLLDQFAEKSHSYFWAAIEYSTEPCEINLKL